MHVRKLGWSCLALALFACPNPPPVGECGGEICSAEQRCDQATLHCAADADPVVTVIAPTAVVTSATFVLSGKIIDDGEFTAEWKLGSGAATPLTVGADGSFSVTIDTPLLDSQTVMIRVAARDAHHEASAEKQLLIDRVAPTVVVTMPAANSVQSRFTDLAVTTTGETAEVTVVFGGLMGRLEGGPTSWTSGPLTLPNLDSEAFVFHLVARDAAGNTASLDHSIIVDGVPPDVVITAPSANSIHRTDLAVSAVTSGDAESVTATLEGVTVPLTGGPLNWAGTVPVPQHDFAASTLRVTAQDALGNAAASEVEIKVDTVAPVITFTAPTAAQKFKASDFTGGPHVTSTWAVVDADSQAATTTVNGAASTALTIAVPTNATDNPTSYMTTVVAADRAGNTATSSVSYSVDRVAPTIVSWTPAANTRMLEPRESVVTFSEPVFGPTASSPALSAVSTAPPQPNDVWDLNHTRYLLPLVYFKGIAVQVGLTPGIADGNGNPVVAPASRKFHIATSLPSGTLVASNVNSFAATADGDGVLRVSYVDTAGNWRSVEEFLGLLLNALIAPVNGTRLTANSWNKIDPVTLNSNTLWASSLYDATAAAGSRYWHFQDVLGLYLHATHAQGAVVSAPVLNREPATDLHAIVLGTTYTRGTFTRTFSTVADMIVAQSADSWAVVNYSGSQVRWSRYRCNRDTQVFSGPATYTCGGTEYGGSTGGLVPDFGEAVMTRGGSCLLVNLKGPQGGGGFAQVLQNCDGALGVSPPASCNPNTSLPMVSGFIGQKLAPFTYNGEDTILFAFPAGTGNPSEYRLEKMLPGQCAFLTTTTAPFSVPNVRDYQPVQIGTKPAFIYVNTSNELRLFIP